MTILFALIYTCSMSFLKIHPEQSMDVHQQMVVLHPIFADFLDLVSSMSPNIISGTRISSPKMV